MTSRNGAKPSTAGNSVKFRHLNERMALAAIRRRREASKAEIARDLDLTPAAAGNIVDALESEGFINQIGKRMGLRGSPSVLYALNPDRVFSIGMKIGRRTLEAIMIDFTGEERARREHDYPWPDPPLVRRAGNSALEDFLRIVDAMPATELSGIGIGVPYFLGGWSDELGFPDDLSARWAATDMRGLFTAHPRLPVHVENDASAAALAELMFGDGARLQDFMHVSIDTVVGGGLVQNGRLQTGPHGNGAALGPLPVSPSALAPAPKGGTRLLHRASVYSLLAHLRRHGTPLDRIRDLNPPPPGTAPTIAAWVDDCAGALVEAIVAIASVVDVKAVVLDSILPDPLHLRLMNEVQMRFPRAALTGIVPPAIIGGRFGARAAPVGAATLPLSALLDPASEIRLTGSERSPGRGKAASGARAQG